MRALFQATSRPRPGVYTRAHRVGGGGCWSALAFVQPRSAPPPLSRRSATRATHNADACSYSRRLDAHSDSQPSRKCRRKTNIQIRPPGVRRVRNCPDQRILRAGKEARECHSEMRLDAPRRQRKCSSKSRARSTNAGCVLPPLGCMSPQSEAATRPNLGRVSPHARSQCEALASGHGVHVGGSCIWFGAMSLILFSHPEEAIPSLNGQSCSSLPKMPPEPSAIDSKAGGRMQHVPKLQPTNRQAGVS